MTSRQRQAAFEDKISDRSKADALLRFFSKQRCFAGGCPPGKRAAAGKTGGICIFQKNMV